MTDRISDSGSKFHSPVANNTTRTWRQVQWRGAARARWLHKLGGGIGECR